MKYIIIGLGHFGSSLGQKLTTMGHEVIGVDPDMGKVEACKTYMTHTVCMNPSEPESVASLPVPSADAVVVCIGMNEGANILATAVMKQMKAKHLICRAISPLHRTILEAMHVDDIVYLEEETAHRWARKLNVKGLLDSYEITNEFSIVEVLVPKRYVGKTLAELSLRNNHNVLVLATVKLIEESNAIGVTRKTKQVKEMASATTVLEEGTVMVLYGRMKDIEAVL
ncbi:MAG TPA: potassium transporter TrkA [Bacteroidales bacterium]|jgi:trk system potassium uptake protein TrkA|nr:TrkA family potassium uptake protein [Bacteroidales bacterium]OPZ95749.1 MAG: Ktr system potassium uptake protein A [Bacteroidetes bacterium ADurb.Bin416]HBL72584.1 potassium transporter TrkA [Bacteroidales bacterium]